MKFWPVLTVCGLLCGSGAAQASEKSFSLDSNELFAIEQAIGAMSGYTALDRDKKAVVLPYDLGPQAVLAMAHDVRIIQAEIADYQGAVKKRLTGDKEKDAKMGADLAAVKRHVTLETFPSSDLKLGENHIVPALISGLWPLFEDKADAPKK